ncbi:hypothetical protein ACQ3I4_09810 [Zafaria sp. Z1313]|uniref:hypothetical protein n=1 Tax=unclassified Zafaria TaxID=2828765 RepID=UPI002E79C676|nr:hypothetical protein [Zafaria sp. J156]MEE1621785.1 hypothetical protein [Zafaria sp. J156]
MNDYLVMFLLLGLPGLTALAIGVWAWSGRWRTWAPRPVAAFFFTRRNYLPLQAGAAGILILGAAVPLTATLERWDNADLLWTAYAFTAAPLAIASRWWWPAAVTPRWHKEWVRRGGTADTRLWGPQETVPQGAARQGWK